MRGVGDEVAAHLLLLLERRGHLVERVGEAGELLRSLARDARRVVAVGDATGRATDLRQWPREHAREHDRQAHAREHGDHRRGDDDGRDRVVVHVPRVLGGVAGFHHQGREDVGPDDRHAHGQDHEPDRRRRDGRQRDPTGDPARDHVRAARYPTPRTVCT